MQRITSTLKRVQSSSKSDGNLSKEERSNKSKEGKKNAPSSSVSTSTAKKKSGGVIKKLFQSCAQCCKGKKARIAKSKPSLVERLKKKTKEGRTKKEGSKQSSAATADHQEKMSQKEKKTVESKKAKRKKETREKENGKEKKYPPDVLPFGSTPFETDQDGKLKMDQILGARVQDFTKSCCFLCAQNAMAIAAAVSGKTGKSHVSIQVTAEYFKEPSTEDKGCSPMIYVRTVQSSVKVKTRHMGTVHPEKKKKDKKPRPKLNFKRFSLVPKVKLPGHPRMRTVACETDKSMGHNNIPQCRAKRGTHCIKENK